MGKNRSPEKALTHDRKRVVKGNSLEIGGRGTPKKKKTSYRNATATKTPYKTLYTTQHRATTKQKTVSEKMK